jgi:hypothetical protein
MRNLNLGVNFEILKSSNQEPPKIDIQVEPYVTLTLIFDMINNIANARDLLRDIIG